MDGVKGCLNDKAKEWVKDRKEWRRIVGGEQMIQGEAGCMKQVLGHLAPDASFCAVYLILTRD